MKTLKVALFSVFGVCVAPDAREIEYYQQKQLLGKLERNGKVIRALRISRNLEKVLQNELTAKITQMRRSKTKLQDAHFEIYKMINDISCKNHHFKSQIEKMSALVEGHEDIEFMHRIAILKMELDAGVAKVSELKTELDAIDLQKKKLDKEYDDCIAARYETCETITDHEDLIAELV